jgi:hypothetical protein
MSKHRDVTQEKPLVQLLLIVAVVAFLVVFLVLPLIIVFVEGFRNGFQTYIAALGDPESLAAIRLTLLVAAIVVPANLLFGIAASWAIAKAQHADRPSLLGLAGHLGTDLCAAVRGSGGARAMARGAWDPDHLRSAGNRARHHVRHLSIRGARAHSADAAAGHPR